jgi:outer membrane receptor protein involved in Fe transport
LFAIAVLPPSPSSAQLQISTIAGVVRDVQRQPLPGAVVVLVDSSGNVVRSRSAGGDGAFQIDDVAPGSYEVRVEWQGTILLTRSLVVRGALPIDLELAVGLVRHDDVIVRGDADVNTVERPWSLAGDALRRNADTLPSQRVQATLSNLPGWSSEDNGLLHVRGVDDGLLYVQDGIPIYERLDRLFGLAPNPSGIASLHVLNGYIPPEFGLKSGGVVEVRSESGVRERWSGTLDAGAGSFDALNVNLLAAGPAGDATGLMFTGSVEGSSRFLDPLDLANYHNQGRAASAGAQATRRSAANVFAVGAQTGWSRYDVPHSAEQESAGQDQQQRVTQTLVSASWQRVLSPASVWQLSAYSRAGAAALIGSPEDTPVTFDGERSDRRYGLLGSVSYQRGRHTLKAGGEASTLRLAERFTFAVIDPDEAEDAGLSEGAIAHDREHPFTFAERSRPMLWSVFVQDVFRASNELTVNFGVRFDRSRLLVPASQWSPRVGVAYQVTPGTVARASVMRLFQPPQAEYLLLASSPEARILSPFVDEDEGGGSLIPPERQTAVETSLSQQLVAGWEVEAALWRRRVRDVADPNVFFGTTVTVPNAVARQHAWGFDARITMRPRAGWSASANYTHARAEQFGPVTGGLFLEDEYLEIRDGTKFIPDHDQRHGFGGSITFADARRHWRATASVRHQTGTPLGVEEDDVEDLLERPGAEVVDAESGRVRPRTLVDAQAAWTFHRGRRAEWSLTAWVTNLANQTYAFNFGNPFSGTHFGSPRRGGISLSLRFGGRPGSRPSDGRASGRVDRRLGHSLR